jgi:hypothetical protein
MIKLKNACVYEVAVFVAGKNEPFKVLKPLMEIILPLEAVLVGIDMLEHSYRFEKGYHHMELEIREFVIKETINSHHLLVDSSEHTGVLFFQKQFEPPSYPS